MAVSLNEIAKRVKAGRLWLRSRAYTAYLRALGARVGRNVTFGGKVSLKLNGDPRRIEIHDDVTFAGDVDLRNRENGAIVIERGCSFDTGLRLVAARECTLRFGEGCSAGMQLVINAGGNVTIGKKCLFSSYVHMNGSAHPTFRDEFLQDQGYIQGTVDIGDDVWLANCVNVLMGARIARGAIVGANSVVSGDIPEYATAMGIPARVIGYRLARGTAPTESPSITEPPFEKVTPIAVSREEALELLRRIFAEVAPTAVYPGDEAPLRSAGILDSLAWFQLMLLVSERVGREIPLEISSSPKFDSIDALASYLSAGKRAAVDLYSRMAELRDQSPKRTALVLKEEGKEAVEISRETLLEQGARFARWLSEEGFARGHRLAIVLPIGEDLAAAYVGCLQRGVIPSLHAYPSSKVPLDIYASNHHEVFSRMGLAGLYCAESLRDTLFPLLPSELKILSGSKWREKVPLVERAVVSGEEIALIQHSSGTTGVQKGVALSHRAILAQVRAYERRLRLDPTSDVVVSWLPLYHDMGLIACFLLPLLTGTKLVVMSPFEWIASPQLLLKLCEKYRGTLAYLPNFAFKVLSRIAANGKIGYDLGTMRAWISCSEPVSAETMLEFEQRFSGAGVTKDKLWSCYAMAENTFAVTQAEGLQLFEVDPAAYAGQGIVQPRAGGRALVSQGAPIENVTIAIRNDEGNRLGENEIGEIWLRSDCMLTEYFENPGATSEAMSGEWYRTGDLGFLHEGELYISGRKKDLIIIAGRNFHPQDIEEVVGSVEGLKPGRVVAFGHYNEAKGTEEIVVLAEKLEGSSVPHEQVVAAAQEKVLQALDCAVTSFHLVRPGTIVKTSSGKISRRACRERFQERSLEL